MIAPQVNEQETDKQAPGKAKGLSPLLNTILVHNNIQSTDGGNCHDHLDEDGNYLRHQKVERTP